MINRLCLHGKLHHQTDVRVILEQTGGRFYRAGNQRLVVDAQLADRMVIENLRGRFQIDINVLPDGFDPQQVGLVVCDMDSTFVNVECIDELANLSGHQSTVAAITGAAMRGGIDYAESLRKRVGLLAGLRLEQLEQVYRTRLETRWGVESLLSELAAKRIPLVLVSGGFCFFAERLVRRFGLFDSLANQLQVDNGQLTGRLEGTLVDGQAKACFLAEVCKRLSITTDQVIAVGDGANDLPMLMAAGLGVAYQAHPVVQEAMDIVLNHSGLNALNDFLGWIDGSEYGW
jgi:phosphoserine phosphatase